MMQHAHRKRVVELARQRQPVNVGLNDVRVWQRTRGGKRRFDRRAEIDPDHISRAPTRGELRVTSFAAPAFKHHLVAEKFGRDRRDPTEKLFGVARVFLREVLPLPTETRSRRAFVAGDFGEVCEARHTAGDGKRLSAVATTQYAFDYLLLLRLLDGEIQRRVTRGQTRYESSVSFKPGYDCLS